MNQKAKCLQRLTIARDPIVSVVASNLLAQDYVLIS